jgi:glycosyltransferase involved in cell wall biosynthesis
MRPVKRIPDLLKIMALVKKWPNIKLLLLAGGDVEQYLPLMKKLGVEKNIIIRKNILDIENYISAADVGIYTSEDESFGMGILETMLYGKPVLSTKVGGIPEVMQHGKTGFLFTVGDTRNFAKKLTELSTDQNLVTKLGAQAYARATNDFSADKKVSEYLAYYQNIIKSGK